MMDSSNWIFATGRVEYYLESEQVSYINPPKRFILSYAMTLMLMLTAVIAVAYGYFVLATFPIVIFWAGLFIPLRNLWKRFEYKTVILYASIFAAVIDGFVLRYYIWR